MRLQTLAPESSLSQAEPAAPFTFGNDAPQTLDHQSLQCRLLPVGQFAGLLKETVWYLYGCFHMANHIIVDIRMSRQLIIGSRE